MCFILNRLLGILPTRCCLLNSVGYSFSDNPNDYNTGDFRTANDAYQFLLNFFKEYPEYANSKVHSFPEVF